MSFRLAHLSDVHLGPLPAVNPLQLTSKRLVGYNSWYFRRRHVHDVDVAAAAVDDIRRSGVDHVALTGDLANISLPAEFTRGAQWLARFGKPEWISFVPGNHDAYVPLSWEKGLSQWAPYMSGDLTVPGAERDEPGSMPFPYVRQRRNFALVGVSTAAPSRPGRATGELGPQQLAALAETLSHLRQQGFYRILMIHHPPLPGMAISRKALLDASDLRQVLEQRGCDLVLHGHNHTSTVADLTTRDGEAHIVGVPSASSNAALSTEPAAWNEYEIRRRQGRWSILVRPSKWDVDKRKFVPQTEFRLS